MPLRQAAIEKVRQGITSVEEALRRTVAHKESLPSYLVDMDLEEYEDGDTLIREGNSDDDFFRLVRGGLAVIKSGKKIAEITEPGEYFGEAEALSGQSRSASIISMGRSTVKRYPGNKLDEIIDKYPAIARKIFQAMGRRLDLSNQLIVKMAGGKQQRQSPKR